MSSKSIKDGLVIVAAALLLFGDLEATPVDTILCEAALALHTLHCLLWE